MIDDASQTINCDWKGCDEPYVFKVKAFKLCSRHVAEVCRPLSTVTVENLPVSVPEDNRFYGPATSGRLK